MRRTIVTALIALFCLILSSEAWAAPNRDVSLQGTQPQQVDLVYPLVLAVGAVAGVVAVNALTYSVGTIPYWVGIPTAAPIISPASAAASRIFVIASGVLGAWIADALYNYW
jgi:uncharacterized membrane protein